MVSTARLRRWWKGLVLHNRDFTATDITTTRPALFVLTGHRGSVPRAKWHALSPMRMADGPPPPLSVYQ